MRHFLIIAFLLSAAAARSEDSSEKPDKKIAVVKTWKELCTQPEIDIGGGVKIKLGVETLRCPRLNGVMLYCVSENFDQQWEAEDPEQQLGPVQFRVQKRGALKDLEKKIVQKHEMESLRARRMLFAQALPIGTEGLYDVAVRDQKGKLLAVCEIEATNESAAVWSPLQHNNAVQSEIQIAGETPVVNLRYDGAAAAVPKIESWMPLRWENASGEREPVSFNDDDPLPNLKFTDTEKETPRAAELAERVRTLVPKLAHDDFDTREAAMRDLEALGKPARALIAAEAKASGDTELRSRARQLSEKIDGEFTARLSGRDFLLTLAGGFETTGVEENVLARWWVNGKPFVPGPLGEFQQEGGPGSSQMTDAILLKLELNAEKLGAKSGDRIAVQFLHCPLGYQIVDEHLEMLARMIREASDNYPRISNKIEFTVP